MRRFRQARSFVKRRETPSIMHKRTPLAPLPLPGCKCDDCEDARVLQDDRIERVMGVPGEAKPEDRS